MLKFIVSLTRQQKSLILLGVDLTVVPLALLFAFALQSLPTNAFETLLMAGPIIGYLVFAAAIISWQLGLPHIQLNAYEGRSVEITGCYAVVVAFVAAILFWVAGTALPAGTYVMFGISLFLFSVAAKVLMYHFVVGVYRRSQPRCRVLIYGAGTTGTQLASALRTHETIDPVAFVDDNSSLQGVMLTGLPVYPPARIGQLVVDRRVDRVLLAMPSLSQPKQSQIARHLQQMGLEVQAFPSFAQLIGEEELIDKLTPVASHSFLGRAANDIALEDAANSYRDRSVLVTGAGGSIGSELCRQVLSCRPKKLVLLEVSELALYTVDKELRVLMEGTDIELVSVLGSVTDPRHVRKILNEQEIEVVLHAAAYKHVPLVEANPLPGLANNVFGTLTLAREAAQLGVERFILVSSDKAVRPTNIMGASKRLAELVVQDLATRNHNTVFTMVRFGNVLGSSGSVVPLFQEQISRGGPVTVTDKRVKRYFMTIKEAVQLVLTAGAEARGGEVFVLDMGELVPIIQLARQVIEANGYEVRDSDNPEGDIEIQEIGLRHGEKLEEELSSSGDLIGTRHRKIFNVQEMPLSEIEVASMLRNMKLAIASMDEEAARVVVQRWVEGFHESEADRRTP